MLSKSRLRLIAGWVLLVLLTSASSAVAQNLAPVPEPTNKPNGQLRPLRGMVTKALRDNQYPNGEADKKDFDDYFCTFFFPQMLEESNRPKSELLPQFRRELRTVYLGAGKTGEVHNHLCELTLNWMRKVIGGNWPMVYKYNAMLVIGEINQKEIDGGARAVPYPVALVTLLQVISSPKFDSQDYLRVAALVGIERHAESHNYSPLGGEAVTSIIGTILPVALQQTAPSTVKRSPGGHNWIRRSAIQILGKLGNPGGKSEVIVMLEGAAADKKAPLSLRCAAAESIAQIKYGSMKIDYGHLMRVIGQVVNDVSETELAEYQKQKEKGVEYELRRVLRSTITPIHEALEGTEGRPGLIASAKGSPQQATVDLLKTKIDAIYKVCNSDKTTNDLLASGLSDKLLKDLQTALNPAAPAAKAMAAGVQPGAPAPPPSN